MLRALLRVLRREDDAQNLAEYCLLTALIALIALGIFCHVSGGIQGMWSTTDTTLAAANATTGTGGAAGASHASSSQPPGQ
jgi:Flp pilus assembly pilin Flp